MMAVLDGDHARAAGPSEVPFSLENVNLARWRRALPHDLGEQLTKWVANHSAAFDEVVSLSSYDLGPATEGLPAATRAWLTADIAMLVGRLGKLARAKRLRVWFGAVRSDRCRKFHVDYLRYRLVTTYVGPGTEWLPDDNVHRDALDAPWDCPSAANKGIIRDASLIQHASPGDVLIMRGAVAPHQGAVHRSPPIEGTGRARVVLIASTVDHT